MVWDHLYPGSGKIVTWLARERWIGMHKHPIPPVTEPMQFRAIGLVRGVYVPEDPQLPTRGVIHAEDATVLEAVLLGRMISLVRRHLDLSVPHLWVCYPRNRNQGKLHLQLMGVWEPSTLDHHATDAVNDDLPEGDGYFSVRGEVIFTKPEANQLVVKIRQQPRADGSCPQPFKLLIHGTVPAEQRRQFVNFDLRRIGQDLHIERQETIGPVPRSRKRGKIRKGRADAWGRSKSPDAGRKAVTRRFSSDKPSGDAVAD